MIGGRNQGRDQHCCLSSLFEMLSLRRLNFERTTKGEEVAYVDVMAVIRS